MGKRKWYVVTVGKDIGVFPTWLEAGPLVKGVPDALHQSFPTEEEARRNFAQAMASGNTRIVGDDRRSTSSRQTVDRSTAFLNGGSDFPSSPHRSAMNLNSSHLSQNHSQHGISHRSGTPTGHFSQHSSIASAPVRLSSPISRSSSEPSSSFRRYEIIDAVFKKGSHTVGAEARASAKRDQAQASTPTRSPTGLNSPRTESLSQTPRAIVMTPAWLTSYPRCRESQSQPLSPLNSADMPLNAFPDPLVERAAVANRAPGVIAGHPQPTPIRLTNSTDEESVGDSSIYLSPSPRPAPKIIYKHDVDPRSPIMNRTQVPELAFVSPLTFSRPSPLVKTERLPIHLERNDHALKSSLLFKTSPLSVSNSVEDHLIRSP